MPVNTPFLSTGTTVLSNLSLNSPSDASIAAIGATFTQVGTSTVSAATAVVLTSLDLRTGPGVLSMATAANATGMTIGQLRVVFLASGISLVYSSGASSYVLGQSTQSAVQA